MSRDERWAAFDADWPPDDGPFDNADGEYPPEEGIHLLLRHGRWLPVMDGPSIDDYQPANGRAGQPEGEVA
jgi:hypothetical protein